MPYYLIKLDTEYVGTDTYHLVQAEDESEAKNIADEMIYEIICPTSIVMHEIEEGSEEFEDYDPYNF